MHKTLTKWMLIIAAIVIAYIIGYGNGQADSYNKSHDNVGLDAMYSK